MQDTCQKFQVSENVIYHVCSLVDEYTSLECCVLDVIWDTCIMCKELKVIMCCYGNHITRHSGKYSNTEVYSQNRVTWIIQFNWQHSYYCHGCADFSIFVSRDRYNIGSLYLPSSFCHSIHHKVSNVDKPTHNQTNPYNKNTLQVHLHLHIFCIVHVPFPF